MQILDDTDRAARALWDANAAEPYVHAEYERADRVFTAHLVILTGGDEVITRWLRDFWADNQEPIRYALAEWFAVCRWAAQDAADLAAEIAAYERDPANF